MVQRRFQALQVQFVQNAQVVVCQGVIGRSCDGLQICGLCFEEFAVSAKQETFLVQRSGMIRVKSKGRLDRRPGLTVVAVLRMDNGQVHVHARICRVLQQEFLESQLRVDEIAGSHDGRGLLEQRLRLWRDLGPHLFFRCRRCARRPRIGPLLHGLRRIRCATGHEQDSGCNCQSNKAL